MGIDVRSDVMAWFSAVRAQSQMDVRRTALTSLPGWRSDPHTGDLRHDSGRFFAVSGLAVYEPGAGPAQFEQPVLVQPETGILGLLSRGTGAGREFLLQAKAEPGNRHGLELAPTVQATRSNYLRAHHGRKVLFAELFRGARQPRLVDVAQSEHGSWFWRKRNRNMIVENVGEIDAPGTYRWFSLAQIHRLMQLNDVVNMSARSVLSCLPPARPAPRATHPGSELRAWLTDVRRGCPLSATAVPLRALTGWRHDSHRIHRPGDPLFEIIGVEVRAVGREIDRWAQPILRPVATGLAAFLAVRRYGVLNLLVHARFEAGLPGRVELAPTVQCVPERAATLHAARRPPHLDAVLAAGPRRRLVEVTLSEEGGRLYHARNRYLVVEVDTAVPETEHYRWMTPHQLLHLVRLGGCVNVQARTLMACLRACPDAGID
ncbi:NDP-hexose 2,3-dehydratase family protein [Actinoplanes sp. TFC3]|uniref:NDP-hexose 2,3-dehydratase family protein n=1 Tax=Actinoplanes sp. TFC3 TaxID=1710355 RepID=UPI00082C7B17|nr:NDP-hexose 2,3-dehydratase family protein [Actinoplanes sp. TFC3]